jgi:hypothetical protein
MKIRKIQYIIGKIQTSYWVLWMGYMDVRLALLLKQVLVLLGSTAPIELD